MENGWRGFEPLVYNSKREHLRFVFLGCIMYTKIKQTKKMKRDYICGKENEKGQASRVILVLAVITLVAILIAFSILKMAEKPPPPEVPEKEEIPLPVYETTINEVKFIFMSAIDRGNRLRASERVDRGGWWGDGKDLVTTERFIMVTIGAQNKGKVAKESNVWDIGNIIDSEGRHFEPLKDYDVKQWIPTESSCGAVLKPEFDPVPCVKIYEVSKISTGLKIMVMTGKKGERVSDYDFTKNDWALLDLIVK